MKKHKEKDTIKDAMADLAKNEHQDLEKENLGIEPEEQEDGDPSSPFKLKGFDDKRPEDKDIRKGWTVDSNTSRGAEDLD